ncbi:hypothetical protein LINPERHAP2_LOCUS9594 [Linum perenne]
MAKGESGIWAVTLWSLWWEHNQQVWKGESRSARLIVDVGINAKAEWEVARGVSDRSRSNETGRRWECESWHVPPVGKLKCNVDASFRSEERKWGGDAVSGGAN